jgi:hypothetical protein
MSKVFGQRFSVLAFTSLLASGLAGCTAQTLEEFEGEPIALAVNYTPGQAMKVTGLNGEIRFEDGGRAGEVHVLFKPFTFDGYDKEEEAREAIENDLHVALAEDNEGAVHAAVDKDGGGSLGAHVIVSLPPEFDDLIHIANRNGQVDVEYVAGATSLWVHNRGAGDCLIAGQPSLRDTNVVCGFDVRVTDVADKVQVRSEGIGDVMVSIAAVAAGSGGGDIRADNGEVNLTVPASTSDFSVQAAAYGGGVVNAPAAPSGCQLQVAAENSKTLSCGAGPNFTVIAGDENSLSYDVNLAYR